MRFKAGDNTEFRGRSYDEIVAEMAGTKFKPPRSLEQYRQAVASRTQELYGVEVDPSSSKSLVESLEQAHVLTRI